MATKKVSAKAKPKSKSAKPARGFVKTVEGIRDQVVDYFSGDLKVTDAVLKDHDDLKALIKILKDEKAPAEKKKSVYRQFKSLLESHTVAEETAVYELSEHLRDLKRKTNEGFVEHDVADSLISKIRTPTTRATLEHWLAQVQVLAELVEHHLKEEERDLLPQLDKDLDHKQQVDAAKLFLKLRAKSQRIRTEQNLGALK